MTMLLENLHQSLLERNIRETLPFLEVHEANATLLNQVDGLQLKCEALERENAQLDSSAGGSGNNGDTAALRNETRLRDKLEKLQEELNEKLKAHQKDTAQALQTANALALTKESHAGLEQKIKKLEQEALKKDKNISHLTQQVQDSKSITRLAEQQYMGLKETIRSLQKENDVMKDENGKLIDRLVSGKDKTSDEVNTLNEMVAQLRKEVDMLRTLKLQDDKRRSWFGGSKTNKDEEEAKKSKIIVTKGEEATSRKFGTIGSILPSSIAQTIEAHHGDASCVRYDSSGTDLLATCGTDSFVKIWDTNSGMLKATLRGSSVIAACDIGGGLAVGGGSDKMCRVWNLKTERMVRLLLLLKAIIVDPARTTRPN
jgi:autophagy-related protein 16